MTIGFDDFGSSAGNLKQEAKEALLGETLANFDREIATTNFASVMKKFLLGDLADPSKLIQMTETKENMGKVGGYSLYFAKYGYANLLGTGHAREIKGLNSIPLERVKTVDYETQIDPYIAGYQGKSDYPHYDDPLFLVYDIEIDFEESPFFNGALKQYINDYSENVPEIEERKALLYYFWLVIRRIFPRYGFDTEASDKFHYIQSISGLDLLTKKMINYPEDFITLTLSEDVIMTIQYFNELYNTIVYSYDTQRYLMPDNLLRFDLKITLSDVRSIKRQDKTILKNDNTIYDKAKSIYILHDCLFDFSNSKNVGNDLANGGFNQDVSRDPATLSFNVIFKSVSKITVPFNFDNNLILDYRKRENKSYRDYQTPNNFDKQKEYEVSPPYVSPDLGALGRIADKVKGKVMDEIADVRGAMMNRLKQAVQGLAEKAQKAMAAKLGFSVTKINVYIDTLGDKFGRISQVAGDFVDDKFFDGINGVSERAPVQYREGNIYGEYDEHVNIEPDGDVHEDGQYNEKYPEGDVHDDGTYNENYPDDISLHAEGQYNENYPEGDVHPDGQYNEKYPDGDLHPDGQYNQKFPDGDVHEDGQYNQKFPDGDVHPDGQYNEKYPEGDLHPDGQYNQKFPEGDVHPDGQYNQKFPDGDVFEDGQYNQKFPEGDVFEDGIYNEKYPDGKRFTNPEAEIKNPDGDVFEDGEYNQKFPEGTLFNNPHTQVKNPEGDVFEDGIYNEKYPYGKVSDNPQLKIKFPDGNVYGNTKNKLPKNPNGNRYKNK